MANRADVADMLFFDYQPRGPGIQAVGSQSQRAIEPADNCKHNTVVSARLAKIYASAALPTLGRMRRSARMSLKGGFLPFEEKAVDDGAPTHAALTSGE